MLSLISTNSDSRYDRLKSTIRCIVYVNTWERHLLDLYIDYHCEFVSDSDSALLEILRN